MFSSNSFSKKGKRSYYNGSIHLTSQYSKNSQSLQSARQNQTNAHTTINQIQSILKQYYQPLVNRTEYHLFNSTDEGGYNHFDPSKRYERAFFLREMLADINFLLYVDNQFFWKHLAIKNDLKYFDSRFQNCEYICNHFLKAFLQSCLVNFMQKSYAPYYQSQDQARGIVFQNQSDEILLNSKLKQVILIIYYRISIAKNDQKQLVFQSDYLNFSTLLNICGIYGEKNSKIVKKIIENSQKLNQKQSRVKFYQMITLALEKIQSINRSLLTTQKIFFENINQEQDVIPHFQNARLTICRILMKTIFSIYDLIVSLDHIYKYFPQSFRIILLEQAIIFKKLLLTYNKLRYSVDYLWQFTRIEKNVCSLLITFTFQKITYLFKDTLNHLNQVLNKYSKKQNLYYLKRTYANICYFGFSEVVIEYENKDKTKVKELYKRYTFQLMKQIMCINHQKEGLFRNKTTRDLFDSNKPVFTYLAKAAAVQKNFKRYLKQKQENQLIKKRFHWKIPSFQQFQCKLDHQNRKKNMFFRYVKKMKEYEDQPQFEGQVQSDRQQQIKQKTKKNFTFCKTIPIGHSTRSNNLKKRQYDGSDDERQCQQKSKSDSSFSTIIGPIPAIDLSFVTENDNGESNPMTDDDFSQILNSLNDNSQNQNFINTKIRNDFELKSQKICNISNIYNKKE